ncbi:UDP-2,3-diacylglucosamine diphosphatase [Candidatus Thiothrix sp. Deng01]|uniref:UDP-2,3-diacylglucosamine hydrolase n=1 Tax=Candidatus Thiothrix phosphatis TaxID=3112415 RepID=A0ABU6CY71_9GAMM|nr:UDP-2,3-diacylglucosamine diphosphatase [Candidatus Thiothrix sp. Deng01]MEB4591780.1 UDP-2,3-diacylglucosamine diphosphatase [Candidatus Thiothrix sp. Deng01]
MTNWFISDLHLDASSSGEQQVLLDFLARIKGRAEALYILGDFFEYWVGDDVIGTTHAAVFQPVMAQLRQVSDSGVRLYFMHGNRDFLVGEEFAAITGCQLLPGQAVIDLYGVPTLLLHGDTLCTDDVEYQQVRKVLRSPQWRRQFLALPVEERIRQAEQMRAQSRAAAEGRVEEMILDVSQQAVEETLRQTGVLRMIHGHTHRPATHDFQLDGQPAQRLVLGDWHADRGSFLRIDATGVALEF